MRQGIDGASQALHTPPLIEHWSHDRLARYPMEEVFGRWLATTRRPTALFFNGDHMACSFMNLALRRGLRIPQDVAILGVDDAPQSAEAVVPLTTVAQPKYEQGQMAARILFDLIDGRPPRQVIFQPELIIRSSTQLVDQPSMGGQAPI